MEFDEPLDHRQAEAGALERAVIGRAALEERRAEPRQVGGVDADAGVGSPRPHASSPSTAARTVTVPPGLVNFTALETRLIRICLSARWSATISGSRGPTSAASDSPPACAFSAIISQQPSTTGFSANGSASTSKLPDSMRDTSRMPLTTPSRCSPNSWISRA